MNTQKRVSKINFGFFNASEYIRYVCFIEVYNLVFHLAASIIFRLYSLQEQWYSMYNRHYRWCISASVAAEALLRYDHRVRIYMTTYGYDYKLTNTMHNNLLKHLKSAILWARATNCANSNCSYDKCTYGIKKLVSLWCMLLSINHVRIQNKIYM